MWCLHAPYADPSSCMPADACAADASCSHALCSMWLTARSMTSNKHTPRHHDEPWFSLSPPLPLSCAAINASSALSAFVQFLSAIPSLLYAVTSPHPLRPDLTLVDFPTLMVLMPTMLLGVQAGEWWSGLSVTAGQVWE